MAITIVNKTALADSLLFNNRFGNKKLNAKQIGAEDLHNWNTLVGNLHKAAYEVYQLCENDKPTEEDLEGLNLDSVYNALRELYNAVGEVNGHKMYVTTKAAIHIIGKSGTGNGNEYAPALQFAMSKKSNAQNYLRNLKKINGINPEAIKEQEEIIEAAEAEISALKDTPDMWKKVSTRVRPEQFRADVERTIARAVSGQKAKSWETLEEEDKARKDAKKKKRQTKRQEAARAKAEATTEATTEAPAESN